MVLFEFFLPSILAVWILREQTDSEGGWSISNAVTESSNSIKFAQPTYMNLGAGVFSTLGISYRIVLLVSCSWNFCDLGLREWTSQPEFIVNSWDSYFCMSESYYDSYITICHNFWNKDVSRNQMTFLIYCTWTHNTQTYCRAQTLDSISSLPLNQNLPYTRMLETAQKRIYSHYLLEIHRMLMSSEQRSKKLHHTSLTFSPQNYQIYRFNN